MSLEEYKALKTKAPQEGLIVGLLWVAAFACYIGQLKYPWLGLMWMPFSVLSLVVPIDHLRGYRNRKLDELPYFKAFVYLFMVFLYATLIMALGQWVYFQFIDGGFLYSELMKTYDSPEFKQLFDAYNDVEGFDIDVFKGAIEQFFLLRPIDIAFQFLSLDVVVSLFLAMFGAVLSMGKKRNHP